MWSNKRTPAFDMQILKENSEKHLPSAELRAVLLPDAAEPEILLTSGVCNIYTYMSLYFYSGQRNDYIRQSRTYC